MPKDLLIAGLDACLVTDDETQDEAMHDPFPSWVEAAEEALE